MNNNRTKIDNFLIELDKFLSKYHSGSEDIYDIENVFIPMFKANKNNRSYVAPNKRGLDIPTLTAMCNNYTNRFVPRRNNHIIENKFDHKRKSPFVQSVAYKFKYKEVKDISYEHIFIKHLLQNSEKAGIVFQRVETYDGYIGKFKDSLSSFLVPEDYDTNYDLIIY